jgi:HD-GYP domain-containing protein (c-di-GMP phosphodiesterase class II)
MRVDLLLKTVSKGIDLVEKSLKGITTNHGKRVAIICGLMGREMGMNNDDLTAFTTCALLHDNALTEWILLKNDETSHCVIGQQNIGLFPFKSDVSDIILYHHENADGSGFFGKKAGEYPFKAELVGISDRLDVEYDFSKGLPKIDFGNRYTAPAKELLMSVLEKYIEELNTENIDESWQKYIPAWEVSDVETKGIAEFFMKIIDAKSKFTAKHSSGIAEKSQVMADYYNYDEIIKARLYLAASLHDIGKLAISSEILEKPGSLTDEEFLTIKNHVKMTFFMLDELENFEDIKNWASNHHEKLDGTGYPFGKNAEQLDFNSRLMSCLDIYQAVSETRPYHPARSHEDTMKILVGMAEKGFIDGEIVCDIDKVLKNG